MTENSSDSLRRRTSTALCAGKIIEELLQLRQDYPDACTDAEAQSLLDKLTFELDANVPKHLKDTYSSPTLGSSPLDISVLNLLLLFELPPARDASDPDARVAAMADTLSNAREHCDETVKSIITRVHEIGIIDCRIPAPADASSALNDARRTIRLFAFYWSLFRELLNYRIETPLFLTPDPMLPYIEVLWIRLNACLDRFDDFPDYETVVDSVHFLYSGLVEGEPDDLQVIDDDVHAHARRVDRFIARQVAAGSFPFQPTRQETNFATVFRAQLHETKTTTDRHWARILQNTLQPKHDTADAMDGVRHLSMQLARFSNEILGALERIEETTSTFDDLTEQEIFAFRSLGLLAKEYLEVRILEDEKKAIMTVGQQAVHDLYNEKVPKSVRTLLAALRRRPKNEPEA